MTMYVPGLTHSALSSRSMSVVRDAKAGWLSTIVGASLSIGVRNVANTHSAHKVRQTVTLTVPGCVLECYHIPHLFNYLERIILKGHLKTVAALTSNAAQALSAGWAYFVTFDSSRTTGEAACPGTA
jgi:hypothetical protein